MKIAVMVSCFYISCCADDFIGKMSLEEKVGQLLMVHFNGEVANEDALELIQQVHVGGFIYYNWANGLHSPEQVLQLTSSLQALTTIPLLIAVDQEGGIVARLNQGFTIFPGNKALGMTNNPQLAKDAAYAMGLELRAVGVNFNLSPVVDVNNNPHNPVIGLRAFGDTPDTVIAFAEEALSGYRQAKILTCLKHFPGHGDVEVDSHEVLPMIQKSKEQLQQLELSPFATLASQADTMMTAHVMVPAIDPVNCATLSKPILDLLRREMHFNGVIISDSLVMEGLLKNCSSIDEAAVEAVNAGCDMLLLGGKQLMDNSSNLELTVSDIQRVHRHLVQAVKIGIISEAKLNESVRRILTLKGKYPLGATDERGNPCAHANMANNIATLALKSTQNRPIAEGVLEQGRKVVMAPALLQEAIQRTCLLQESQVLFFKGLNPNANEIQVAAQMAYDADVLIFLSYNAWKNPCQEQLIHSLLQYNKVFVLMVMRDPLDAELFLDTHITLTTFSPTSPSIQAAYNHIFKTPNKQKPGT